MTADEPTRGDIVEAVSTELTPPGADGVPLRRRLRAALPQAVKARDRVAVTALRSALAAIENAEAVDAPEGARSLAIEQSPVGVGAGEVARRALTAEDEARVVRAEMAERHEAAAGYERGGLLEEAERLRAEARVLAAHLGVSG